MPRLLYYSFEKGEYRHKSFEPIGQHGELPLLYRECRNLIAAE